MFIFFGWEESLLFVSGRGGFFIDFLYLFFEFFVILFIMKIFGFFLYKWLRNFSFFRKD